ncbi:MAG: hypothetical protein KF836_09300 [Fimbriimonadaceae bacterium]|nr:hypothetical protein [Fimbriimonadaceae bacterium]
MFDFDNVFALPVFQNEIVLLRKEKFTQSREVLSKLTVSSLNNSVEKLLSGIYQPSFSSKIIRQERQDGTMKSRGVTRQSVTDLVFQRVITRVLTSHFPTIHANAYGVSRSTNDKSFDVRACCQKVSHLCKQNKFVYETDLKNYYPSIRKHLLFERLGWDGIPERICKLIDPFTKRPGQSKGVSNHNYKRFWPRAYGIFQGTTIAPYLAACFLKDVDDTMSREFPGYIRYVDDIVVLTESQCQSTKAESLLTELLDNLSIEYYKSGQKSARNGSTAEGFLFLGIHFADEGTRSIPNSKSDHFRKHITEILDSNTSFDLAFLKAGTFLQTWFSYYHRLLGCKHDYEDCTTELQLQLIRKIVNNTSISKDQALEFIDLLNCKRFNTMNDDVRGLDADHVLRGFGGTDLNQIVLIK